MKNMDKDKINLNELCTPCRVGAHDLQAILAINRSDIGLVLEFADWVRRLAFCYIHSYVMIRTPSTPETYSVARPIVGGVCMPKPDSLREEWWQQVESMKEK